MNEKEILQVAVQKVLERRIKEIEEKLLKGNPKYKYKKPIGLINTKS